MSRRERALVAIIRFLLEILYEHRIAHSRPPCARHFYRVGPYRRYYHYLHRRAATE